MTSALRHLPVMTLAFALALGATIPALAGERATPPDPSTALPGVDKTYSIVTPHAEPEEPEGDGKTFKAGNWEVTVSGYVWVQVGASSGR